MISKGLLAAVVGVEAAVIIGALTVAVVHALWTSGERRRSEPRLRAGREALAQALDGRGPDAAAPVSLQALPRRLRSRLVAELAPSLRGTEREQLARLAVTLGLVADAERRCASRWWWRRLHGAHLLTLYGAGRSLTGLLTDPHPSVRAQALEWAGDHPDPEVGLRLLDALDDDSPLCRYTAKDALLRGGPAAVALLDRAALATTPVRALEAVLDVAAVRPDPRYGELATALASSPETGVRARAATVLGALGGDAAAGLLESLLGDPEATVRGCAAAGLGHIGHWPAAAALARLLRDRAWVVRRSAGEALLRLGPPGQLMLRRYVGDADAFASDMARQMLELADLRAGRAAGTGGG